MRVAMRYWLTAMSVGMLLGAAGPAHALVFKSLIIFGDSLGDSGNNAFVFDRIVAPSLPPGTLRTQTPIPSQAFIPTFPYTSNRYSNGPVWVEQLADLLGMSALASNLGGTNFAFAGARTGPLGSSFPFSLLDQVAGFLAPPGNNAPVDALYIIMGGGNDLRDILENGADPNVVIPTYVSNIRQILTRLHSEGAENFLLVNVPARGVYSRELPRVADERRAPFHAFNAPARSARPARRTRLVCPCERHLHEPGQLRADRCTECVCVCVYRRS
jgi:outer membrane lipase/esterase